MPTSDPWSAATYGNGKFIAVSKGDTAAYSTDGTNWTTTPLPLMCTWRSVTYGAGKFVTVALNSDKAAYSTDGITW